MADGKNLANTVSGVSIAGSAYVDTITNSGDFVTIDARASNDSIRNFDDNNRAGSNVLIDGGAGDDTIKNGDTFYDSNTGQEVTINGGDFVTINGGAGYDRIYNYGGASVLINGGEDTDYITNTGDNVTINGGKKYDNITNYGNNVRFIYNSGDGVDYITGFNRTSTLQIGDGTDTYFLHYRYGDVVITVGENQVISLNGAVGLGGVHINNEIAAAHTISNSNDNTLVTVGKFDDTVQNIGDNVDVVRGFV